MNLIEPVRRIGPQPGYAGGFVVVSFCYTFLRWLLEFIALRARSKEFKELEIVVLILDEQHLQRVLDVFVEHYNGHRPHRALALAPPSSTRPPAASVKERGDVRVLRRDRLGGVVREYVLAA